MDLNPVSVHMQARLLHSVFYAIYLRGDAHDSSPALDLRGSQISMHNEGMLSLTFDMSLNRHGQIYASSLSWVPVW